MSALCIGAVAFVIWSRYRTDRTDAQLATRLPAANAVRFYLNVQALRAAGLLEVLAGSRAAEETDYRRFVDSTGFDYREDLDAILVGYRRDRWYFLLRGRFDWDQLQRFAAAEGGRCANAFCQVPSKRPDRYVSFYALQQDVLALAIGDNPNGAYVMSSRYDSSTPGDVMRHPMWIRIAPDAIDESGTLPEGSRALVTALKMTQEVTLALKASLGGFELELNAPCEGEERAGEVLQLLRERTAMLKAFLSRDKVEPDPASLAAVLAGGRFEREGAAVKGAWPLTRAFLEAVAQGSM
jgi:hypothetical protein